MKTTFWAGYHGNSSSTAYPISFAHNLQAVATRYLKQWPGLPKCANSSILYRKRENWGLQLQSLTTHLKCMQQRVEYRVFKYSADENTKFIYGHIAQRKGGKSSVMVYRISMKEKDTFSSMSCAEGQTRRQGLGFIKEQKCIDLMTRENTGALYHLWQKISNEHVLISLYGTTKQGRGMGDRHADGY